MLQSYFKIAWRNLLRNRAFTAINIVGLAIGLATCLLIMLFVLDELSYDRYNDQADRIVRVVFRGSINGEMMREASVMPPVAQTLKADYPEVLDATRLRLSDGPVIVYGDKTVKENAMAFVDPNFFEVFTLPLIQGNLQTALAEPNTVVITRAAAEKYFGSENPIGKVLHFKNWNTNYTVTGLIEQVPHNSHFHFDFFGSMAGLSEAQSTSWMTSNFHTYLVLPKDYDYRQLQAKLPQVAEKYMSPQLKQAMGMDLGEFRRKGNDIGLYLQPLTDIHLRSDVTTDLEAGGDIRYVYIFGAIALFMLLIACINFMNLSTAGASKRTREVGIRKVMGSVKTGLIQQFLLESVLLTAVALVLAIGLAQLALPLFNDLAEKELNLRVLAQPRMLASLAGFGLLVGVLAGSYPAFFLSSFKPIAVLKGAGHLGKAGAGQKSIGLRSGLVVFQFFISFMLMVGTTVVYRQLQYIQNKKLGYDKEQVLVLRETGRLGRNEALLHRQLLQDPRVTNASISGYLPAGLSNSNNYIVYTDDHPSQLVKTLRYEVDDRYIPTMGMEMVGGRNFSRDFATDSSAVVINETAARAFGWAAADAIGHTITRTDNEGRKLTLNVIGIVRDFHFKSLHERISPLVMSLGGNSGAIIVKAKGRDLDGLLASVKKQWLEFATETPFAYDFLDESFNATYRSEQKTGRILGIFAGLTIFVACLGLLGLAIFTAERRTKEMGVRKVLGASVASIVLLLSKDFLKLVLIGMVLASPVAWYVMNQWLQDFAYKIHLEWWMFALAGMLAVAVALLTVSFQSVKAAVVNPVKSLRSE